MSDVIDMVQDRKTGEWYNPQERFADLMETDWFQAQLRRMKDEAWEEGMTDFIAHLKGQ